MREVVKELVKSAEGDPFRFCAMCRRLVVALRARSPKGSHPIVRAAIGLSDGDRTTLLAALKTWVGLETWEAVMDATSSITGDMTAATLLKNVYGDMLFLDDVPPGLLENAENVPMNVDMSPKKVDEMWNDSNMKNMKIDADALFPETMAALEAGGRWDFTVSEHDIDVLTL